MGLSILTRPGHVRRNYGRDETGSTRHFAQGLVTASQVGGTVLRTSADRSDEATDSDGDSGRGAGRMSRLLVAGRDEALKLATSTLLVRLVECHYQRNGNGHLPMIL